MTIALVFRAQTVHYIIDSAVPIWMEIPISHFILRNVSSGGTGRERESRGGGDCWPVGA